VSAVPEPQRDRLDTFGGLLSATAIFVGLLGMTNLDLSISGTHLEMRPIRIGVAAIALALVASAIGGRHSRLATIAVATAGLSWVAGMIIAVVTQRPIF
jgi:site-specific recombinase